MRVLIVTDWKTPEGGVEGYLQWLRAALRERGDDARLLTSTAGSCAYGTAEYTAYGTERTAEQVVLQVANPRALAGMRRALEDMRPDVVLVNMFEFHLSPLVLRPLADVPAVLMVHYYKPICPNGMKVWPDGRICDVRAGTICLRTGCSPLPLWLRDRPRYALIRSGLQVFDRFLTVSEWMEHKLAANGVEATGLPLPVDPPAPGFAREPDERPLFLFAGRIAHEKGVDFLVSAFARVLERHPDARLRIVGDGAQRPEIERLVDRLGIRGSVELPGSLPPDRVPEELARAWALVVPSRLPEPGSLVAVEGTVHGVPVIGGATGVIGELVEPGVNGWLFPNSDEDALVACLEQAIAAGPLAVPEEKVRQMRERHDRPHHLEQLRAALAGVAGRG